MQNLQIDAQRLWDSLMETAQIGATRKGRHLPPHSDRSRSKGARLVQGAMRGARLHRDRRRHGQHVRAPPGQEPRASPDRHGLASRHPADRRQIRRRAWRARRARSAAHAARDGLRDQCSRSRSSTGPTRKARALRRRCWPRASLPACSRATTPMRGRTATAKPSARNWRASAIAARKKPARANSPPCSSCTSSKARSSKTKPA